jgi:hypothetical protein
MSERVCEHGPCGRPVVGRKRYCSDSHRALASKARRQGVVVATADRRAVVEDDQESIAEALRAELEELGVMDRYEARTTLRLARQLDSGVIVGAAYVSQSKELDRRVEELRRRAPKKDDATQMTRESVRDRKLRLASG